MSDEKHSDENRSKQTSEGSPRLSLAERALEYRKEIERIVREVGEHALCEMKRSCSLTNLAEKIEFVKDIQSIATSRIETEKFLVIGADAANKKFQAVHNVSEFDEAVVRQILDKYLNPVPEFEQFQLQSSDAVPFILFVIPKQRTRRILARSTVESTTDAKPKLLLREGDLWTKGGSTGKRLAKPEDWDEIYEDVVEVETERRTRQRTAHNLEIATAREKVRPSHGPSSLPSFFTDEEFLALMEDLCSGQDKARFGLLLERLRDDLVEGWQETLGYEDKEDLLDNPMATLTAGVEKVREHIKNVFRPAMHWLTLAGICVVKNNGPISFLDAVGDLLKEVFDVSRQLEGSRFMARDGRISATREEHDSHTVPALESLCSLHLIGAYLTKRGRFQYLRSLFRIDVFKSSRGAFNQSERTLLVFWPLRRNQGEPKELAIRGGNISYSAKQIETDSTYRRLFGSTSAAIVALCQYEFCLELNSFVASANPDTQDSHAYVSKMYPEISFEFYPGLIAFRLDYVTDLALTLLKEIRTGKTRLLDLILFDPALVGFLKKPESDMVFARFVSGLAGDAADFFMRLQRFPLMVNWPKELNEAMKLARQK
jgi:hypothetical protein